MKIYVTSMGHIDFFRGLSSGGEALQSLPLCKSGHRSTCVNQNEPFSPMMAGNLMNCSDESNWRASNLSSSPGNLSPSDIDVWLSSLF